MQININDIVKVRLTEHALNVLQAKHKALFASIMRNPLPFVAPKTDADGWSEWQLWELMHEFGPDLYVGGSQFFVDNEIRIGE